MTEFVVAVATPRAAHFLPLDAVIELTDMLVVGPALDEAPGLAGTAVHRDEALPVYSLDVLLGEAEHGARSWEDRDWGGFVIASIGSRSCAIGVSRIIGLVRKAERAATLDLPALLTPILPARDMAAPAALPEPAAITRYLLLAVDGRRCAIPVNAVERVDASCRMVRAAGADGAVLIGVGTVEGRVLPVIDLRALLGAVGSAPPEGYVVAATADIGRLILAVDRILGISDVADDAIVLPPEGMPPSIVATAENGSIWILSPSLIMTRNGGGR